MTTKDLSRVIASDKEEITPEGFVRYDEQAEIPGGMLYNIAPKYSEEESYTSGALVIYEGILYKASSTASGAFDPTKWTKTTIAAELSSL